MELTSELKDKINSWFDSEECKNYFDKLAETEKFIRSINQKYFDKLNAMTKQERKELCIKIHDKYSSDKYLDKEYKLSYEPRFELYYFLFEYALKYGKPYEDKNETYFPTECYIIDDDIVMEMIYGQGSFCTMFFLEK